MKQPKSWRLQGPQTAALVTLHLHLAAELLSLVVSGIRNRKRSLASKDVCKKASSSTHATLDIGKIDRYCGVFTPCLGVGFFVRNFCLENVSVDGPLGLWAMIGKVYG